MKISKLFHWLYFAVMMLPIFIFPIFALAVRSDNNYQPITISVEKDIYVDFNQKIPVSSNSIMTLNGVTWTNNGDGTYTANGTADGNSTYLPLSFIDYPYIIKNHKYLCKCGYDATDLVDFRTEFISRNNNNDSFFYVDLFGGEGIYTATDNGVSLYLELRVFDSFTVNDFTFMPQIFDLTQMYGVGNEPSISEFNDTFNASFYSYTLSDFILIGDTSVTYNDTDVGSQMVYVGYKVVDNYFNYDNVFNFGSLYSWFELNFFSGNATLGFFIFFHLLEYWLLTSLLWLIFDILMYVPQLCHRWLDKASLE